MKTKNNAYPKRETLAHLNSSGSPIESPLKERERMTESFHTTARSLP